MVALNIFRPESIKELRVKEQLSIADFLKKTGVCVTRSAVSRWELGIDLPTLKPLIKIANAYGVPINYFFSYTLSSNDNLK